MQPIVIVPHTLLGSQITRDQKHHLLLSHFVKASSNYRDFYRQRREEGDYLILDNSAHEFGHGEAIQQLILQASDLGAQEVVLPDVLFDSEGTIDRTWEAIRYIVRHRDLPERMPTSWMMVPQGRTLVDWHTCLIRLLTFWQNAQARKPEVFKQLVIGLSKDYSETFQSLQECLTFAVSARKTHGAEIHLLGWPKPLWTIRSIAAGYGNQIRTTDSSRPITYAVNGILLDPAESAPNYPGRPENFFDYELDVDQYRLAVLNSMVYRDLVAPKQRNIRDFVNYPNLAPAFDRL